MFIFTAQITSDFELMLPHKPTVYRPDFMIPRPNTRNTCKKSSIVVSKRVTVSLSYNLIVISVLPLFARLKVHFIAEGQMKTKRSHTNISSTKHTFSLAQYTALHTECFHRVCCSTCTQWLHCVYRSPPAPGFLKCFHVSTTFTAFNEQWLEWYVCFVTLEVMITYVCKMQYCSQD